MATATRTRTTRKASPARTRKSKVDFITAGQAWEALGGNEKFKPSDMDAPASNRMLWALNNAGKLALV